MRIRFESIRYYSVIFLDSREFPTKDSGVASFLAEMTRWYRLAALLLHQHVLFPHSVSFTNFIYLISTSPKSLSIAKFSTCIVNVKRLAGRIEENLGKDAGGGNVIVLGKFRGKYVWDLRL